MKRPALLPLVMILAYSCCGEKDTTIRFPLCDLFLMYKLEHGSDAWAEWSPDGDKIAFYDPWDLSFISPHGGKPTVITDLLARSPHPNWRPTVGSDKLVFVKASGPDDYNHTICTIDLNVGEPKAIRSFVEEIGFTSWSHDGEKIVFMQTGGNEQGRGIFTIPAGGGYVTEIPNSQGWNNTRVKSAQASQARNAVIYMDQQTDGIFRLNSIDIGGGEPTTIISFPYGTILHDPSISVSQDGSMIALCANYPSNRNIILVPSTGGEMIFLTEFDDDNSHLYKDPRHASWSPDGDELAVSLRNESSSIADYPSGIYMAQLKL
ncbi:hypothetical protein ACFLT7_00780 [candidate division KSB1 bacterium]